MAEQQADRTAELEAELLQGARGLDNSTENIPERLFKSFKAIELVEIENVLPHPFGWVYTDPKETVVGEQGVHRNTTYGAPKSRVLQPGEKKIIPGWEAYIALERMWKAYAQLDITQVAFVLQSGQEMEAFIAKAYHGIFDPNTASTRGEAPVAPVEPPAPVAPTEDPTLGFSDGNDQGGEQEETVTTPPITDQQGQGPTLPQIPGFQP